MRERFVVLGVAPVRRTWFSNVSRWAHEAALPIEFIKCISTNEAISRLESSRPFSALLIDASATGIDRDLLDLATSVGCAPVIVDHGLVDRDWADLGAKAVIPERFDPADLIDVLEANAMAIGTSAEESSATGEPTQSTSPNGRVVAVTGPGGMGSSTIAMALTQGLAETARRRPIVLADMALHASQAMLHDTRDVVPGLIEFIESHRLGSPTAADAMSSVHSFPERGYDLLLGLRHHRDWTSVPARALAASWTTMTSCYETTVCDITGDFDGLEETGSEDIEDRNRLARQAARKSDLVLVVSRGGAWGMRHLISTIVSLEETGVETARIMPVINFAPRNPRAKAEISKAIVELLNGRSKDAGALAPAVFVPFRKNLDSAFGSGDPLPNAITAPLVSSVDAVLRNFDDAAPRAVQNADPEPVLVTPGSLGTWSEIDD